MTEYQPLEKLRKLAHTEVNPVLRAEYAQAYAAVLEKGVVQSHRAASQPIEESGTSQEQFKPKGGR